MTGARDETPLGSAGLSSGYGTRGVQREYTSDARTSQEGEGPETDKKIHGFVHGSRAIPGPQPPVPRYGAAEPAPVGGSPGGPKSPADSLPERKYRPSAPSS